MEEQGFEKMFAEHQEELQMKFEEEYNNSLAQLKTFYFKYSAEDILYSLFTISLWIKNISGQVKLQLAYMVFSSINLQKFQKENKINTYEDFAKFTDELIKIFPNFYMLEDYFPEMDWGEIKYFHNKKIYKMFYGNNFDGIYEYLEAYNIIHCTIDDTYKKIIKRSPVEELEQVLEMQEYIIDVIKDNFIITEPLDIVPGYFEIPSEIFWENCVTFYKSLQNERLPNILISYFTLRIGDIPSDSLDLDVFLNDFHEDKNYRFMFIELGGTYFPILPRRYLSLIIEVWGEIFQKNKTEILGNEPTYSILINKRLSSYIKNRVPSKNFFELVSPFDKNKHSPSESVYSCSFIVRNELFFIYIVNPSYGETEIVSNLKEVSEKIKNDKKILNQVPITVSILDSGRGKVIGFEPNDAQATSLTPKFMVLISRISFSLGTFDIPEELFGSVMLLEDFLGITDEIEDFEEFRDFLDFMYDERNGRHPLNTALDMYGAYKDSNSLIVTGAIEPTFISIESGWGSEYRYKKLKEFWSNYPSKNLFNHPRSYKVEDLGRGLIRLISRGIKNSLLFLKVNNTNIFINAPFIMMNMEEDRASDLLMQTLQDGLSMYKDSISSFQLFQHNELMHIFIFPYRISLINDNLKHLRHLNPGDNIYKMDYGFPNGIPAIRIGYNYDKVMEMFKYSIDRRFEIEFICEVVEFASQIYNDNCKEAINLIRKDTTNLPRFKINVFDKLAAFPEREEVVIPETYDFKVAKKVIAKTAMKNDVKPGKYSIGESKEILNKLKTDIVDHINIEIKKFNFKDSIGFLIAKTDAVNHKYEFRKLTYEESLKHEVDYSREEKYAENHSEYLKNSRNFRYLIEKFVQFSPNGSEILNRESLKVLLALVDWLHVIQIASDMIHYTVMPAGITVRNDFQVDVDYSDDIDSKEKDYGEEEAALELEIKGNPNDRADSTRDAISFLDKFDEVYINDLGFGLRNLSTCLAVLSHWAEYDKETKEAAYYKANFSKLYEITNKAILNPVISKAEYKKIIDFLILKPEEILNIIGKTEPCPDLPIWEHNKRPMRYNLKPLIKINDEYFWGPYSTRKTQEIWIANTSNAMFPYDIQTENIKNLLDEERKNISKALNIRAEEIINRHTKFMRSNCEIHKTDKTNNYPTDLGDFDVLALLNDKRIILNVECKNHEPPFCLKDSRRLRDRLFGRNDKDKGDFAKVIRREEFLQENYKDALKSLKWPVYESEPYKIVTIFLIRRNYWWTIYPPFDTDVTFLRVDLLDEFVKNLKLISI
ncbi:MAG: hypothetical protein EHM58_15345 [Ignavibacteriae bacterium]|nr:MAG: hypothetical protein EHM58_15345 [Ignavibacteriota bacterium]